VKSIAILPLDDRPVNYDYPRYLGRAAGLTIELPPREWLGNPSRASRHAELVDWLSQAAPQADALIVAIDTLAYGGLIPSRTSAEPVESVLARLAILRELKAAQPEQPILASSVILRISRANSSEEEKPYWATYGSRMFRLSYLEHKIALGEAAPSEVAEQASLRAQIPGDVYEDYRRGRERNHAVNLAMLDWLAQDVLDYLLLPQDDTADYGWNIAEARTLQALIRRRGLTERAITYPGADEIGCLLLARYVCQKASLKPRIYPRYSGITSPTVITAYEDRPIHELLKAHLAPLDGTIADSPQDADLLLYVNAPTYVQGSGELQWLISEGLESVRANVPPSVHPYLESVAKNEHFRRTQREMQVPHRSPEEFVRALRVAVQSGQPVALADVAFVNGADLILGNLLIQYAEAAELAAYGGWNTAGNTLGTVLAQAVIRALMLRSTPTLDQLAAHYEFLFLRFLDDYIYQARERTRCMVEDLPALGINPTQEGLNSPEQAAAVEARVCERLTQSAEGLRALFMCSSHVRQVELSNIYLPWQRLFEVGFDVKVEAV
jgi:Protein of unknown function (DUF4127)